MMVFDYAPFEMFESCAPAFRWMNFAPARGPRELGRFSKSSPFVLHAT